MYLSRRQLNTEFNYSNIEKEAKGITGARQYFSDTLKKVLQGGH